MARFLATTVQGNMSVNGNILIGENETPVQDIINNNFNNIKKLFMMDYTLDYTIAKGANWSSIDASHAYLIGNVIRLYAKITRSSAPSGNISNEDAVTFTINHGGKILGIYNVCCANAATGNFSSWYTSNSTSGDSSTVTVRFSGTRDGNTGKQFAFYVHLPVELNTEYFDGAEEE